MHDIFNVVTFTIILYLTKVQNSFHYFITNQSLLYKIQNEDSSMSSRVTLVKTENGHITDDSNAEPLNFKVVSTVTSSRPEHIPMEIEPVTTNSSSAMETCNTIIPHSSSLTSPTKIYANLESENDAL